jgi:hypothetical protein
MAAIETVQPVKRFVAVLWSEPAGLECAVRLLIDAWGALDHAGPDHGFDVTDYYADEMGGSLRRRLFAFDPLMPPESLVDAKLLCNDLEARLASNGRRRVNLDTGYLDHNKVVLASVKYAGQKIYLARGIYADLVARFKQGRYQPFEWTFPDFRDGRYDQELVAIRQRYLAQLRDRRGNAVPDKGTGDGRRNTT